MATNSNLRIAWLLPSAVLYWQPLLSEFSRLFPQTTVFTALWRGFIQGFEDTFIVEVLGQRKFVQVGTAANYSSGVMYLTPKIVGRLLQVKPDVIFTNSFGLWTILALLSKPFGGWRVVVAYEGSSPGVDYCNSALRTWLRKQLVKQADALLTNSESGKEYLLNHLKAEGKKVFQKPYEVPDPRALQTSASVDLQPLGQQPIFIFVGHIIARKDLRSLLKACALLESQGHQNYSLVIVGEGEQRQELEAYCAEQQLQNRVQWLGKVPYEQVGAYLSASDVFVLPTLEDTWGMVVLEAMMLGKPVVCSNGAGAAELITNGESGYRFQPQDIKALATAMKHFIENPGLAKSMGDTAQKLMAQHNPAAAAQFLSEVVYYTLKK